MNSLTHTHTDLWAVIHVSVDQPYMQLRDKELAGCHRVHMLTHEYITYPITGNHFIPYIQQSYENNKNKYVLTSFSYCQ